MTRINSRLVQNPASDECVLEMHLKIYVPVNKLRGKSKAEVAKVLEENAAKVGRDTAKVFKEEILEALQ